MTKPIQTFLTVVVVGIGVIVAAVLGLWGYLPVAETAVTMQQVLQFLVLIDLNENSKSLKRKCARRDSNAGPPA